MLYDLVLDEDPDVSFHASDRVYEAIAEQKLPPRYAAQLAQRFADMAAESIDRQGMTQALREVRAAGGRLQLPDY
jgi:hypothetical protein